MKIEVTAGDILDVSADVLICSANTQLNMTGGVNGAILLRGGEDIQQELHAFLKNSGRRHVPPGSVVCTRPGPLDVKHILHAVAVDGAYRSDVGLVAQVIGDALVEAERLGGVHVTLPALATGYGPLSMEQFAASVRLALDRFEGKIRKLTIVLRHGHEADAVRKALSR